MKMLSRCYYHQGTSSVITDRSFLDTDTLSVLRKMLPEDKRYGLKFVTVCLEDGVAGEVDRESLVSALEVFGQIRDSGVSPKDILREVKKKTGKISPAVKVTNLATQGEHPGTIARPRKAVEKRKKERPAANATRK